jgi:putative addiction module killer protein
MFELRFTRIFEAWLEALRDGRTRRRIQVRVDRIAQGNFGDFKHVGGSVMEARVHFGPGYRLYFCQEGNTLIVMLAGGDKSSQSADIERAMQIQSDLDGDHYGD